MGSPLAFNARAFGDVFSGFRYRLLDNNGNVKAQWDLEFEPADVAWGGGGFSIGGSRVVPSVFPPQAEAFVQRIDRHGRSLGDPAVMNIGGAFKWNLVPARGVMAILFPYVERFTAAHDAGLRRYGFSWLGPRRRSAGR